MRSDLIDIAVVIHHETKPGFENEGAVLVSDDGEREGAVWLPKSAIEIERKPRAAAVVTMPEKLALEKGLI